MNLNDQPMATYRLQFNHDFRFTDAQTLVPYFSRLGITHVYASPVLRAREASTHGYDVVDPKTVNPNLGNETDLTNLVTDLRKFGLGLILDIVPNHMAASIENPYWRDVLTYGPSSPFARWFDIDWRMPDPEMWGRVLVPVLGEPRSRVLKDDQIRVVWSDGRFLVQYFDHVFPVDPSTVPAICELGFDELKERLSAEHPSLAKISDILARLQELPKLAARLRRRVDIDREDIEQLLGEFAQLVIQSPSIQEWVERTAEQFGKDEGGRRLKKLLDNQPYRLVHWREAARTINYRRFFDINELISIRQEDPQVFEETHATVLRWVGEGLLDGLRIDHVDGLRDPLGYLQRLAEALASIKRPQRKPVPVFVEKILAPEETLPCGWSVAGTTGYEFLNQVEAVFISARGFEQIEQLYRRLLRRPVQFEHVALRGKRRVMQHDLSPHVGRLADTLLRLAEPSVAAADQSGEAALAGATGSIASPPRGLGDELPTLINPPEPTRRDFVDAIVEVVAALPVYRTYVDGQHGVLSESDRQYLQAAIEAAHQNARAAPEAIDFLAEVLLLEPNTALPDHEFQERVNFVERFQQLTGPAAAKGIEDTALYAHVPLVSLNEVGGEPLLPEDALAKLHQANELRATTHPQTMLCTTTHDTKRTADVRARLDVLSELPTLWAGVVRRWQRLNRPLGMQLANKYAPDTATEYLCYQSLIGIWPAPDPNDPNQLPTREMLTELRERLEQYMLKAIREAKTNTSWTNNNKPYEEAVLSFVRKLLDHNSDGGTSFLSDVQNLVARIVRPGFWNSLSRTLIQFTSPGTPDVYQGDELWNFALVDPDNRRPVDYEQRQRLLDEVITGVENQDDTRPEFIRAMVESPEDGRIKLHLIHSALTARREHSSLFASGQYLPLAAEGSAEDHVVAFARIKNTEDQQALDGLHNKTSKVEPAAIVVIPRLTVSLLSGPAYAPIGEAAWSDTFLRLPEQLRNRSWSCLLTRALLSSSGGDKLSLAKILQSFPAALLFSE